MENLGVIIEKKAKDFVAGTLPYEVLNPSGDWTKYLPSAENQFTHHTDSMACVTFSCLNVIETMIKFFTGQEVNFSDRFIAKMSGTTPQGNTIQKVLDTINQYGLVLEKDWPTDFEFNWDQYYAPIPQSVIDKAIKLGAGNDWIQYEFHYPNGSDYAKELKHLPLEMILESNNPYHSVEMVNTTQQFDQYEPNLRPQKSVYLATKILLKGLNMKEFVQITDTEFGLLFTTDFVKTVVRFTSAEDAKEKLKNMPGALNADGSVDFSKARKINL